MQPTVTDFVRDGEAKAFRRETGFNANFSAVLSISDDSSIGTFQTAFFDSQSARFEGKGFEINFTER